MKPPFPWSGGGLLAQAGSEQLRDPPSSREAGGHVGAAWLQRCRCRAAAGSRRIKAPLPVWGVGWLPPPGRDPHRGGSPNHGPGSERVGPLQNAKSQHMRVPGFRAEGQPITGEGQECGLLHLATCEFLRSPSFWLQPIRDEPKNQAPSGRAFKKDISRHARLKNRESFIIADFGPISVAVGTANRGRRRNARPSLPPAGSLRAGRFRTTT